MTDLSAREIYIHARRYCMQEARFYRRTRPDEASLAVQKARRWSGLVRLERRYERYEL